MSDIIYTSKYAVDRMDPFICSEYNSGFIQKDNTTSGWVERSSLPKKLGHGLGWMSTCSLSEQSESGYISECDVLSFPRRVECIDHLLTEVDECDLADEKSCVDPSESCTSEYDYLMRQTLVVENTDDIMSTAMIEPEPEKSVGDKISESLESSIFSTMCAEFSAREYDYV
jgi:hypothetical protein